MERKWWHDSVVYQIYPRSFKDSNGDGVGDLVGVIEKLDYLKELGIDVIWLSPVYDSPNDDNGYDIRDYEAIMEEFGTMADFDRLLDQAHERGIKIVMDLVVNHSSDEHAWFAESRKSKENPYRDYYIWRSGQEDGTLPNNWGSIFSGPAWELDETTNEYYLHLFSKKQPDLNWENEQLRQEVYQMITRWLDRGIDGFRMDVINLISKTPGLPDATVSPGALYGEGGQHYINGPRIHEFLKEMNDASFGNYDVLTVGEMPGATTDDAILYTDPERKEVNMVFTFEHMDLDSGPNGKWDVQPFDLQKLKTNFTKWQVALHEKGWNSLYWNNHDQPRVVSRFGNDTTYRVASAKMLATLLHLLKGTPYIYQGEEIGMTNVAFESIDDYEDIEIRNMWKERIGQGASPEDLLHSIHLKGRDNARTPIQWDATDHGGFTTGTPWLKVNPNYPSINVEQALQDPNSIFYYYKQLIALRHQHDLMVYGEYALILEEEPEVYAYTRTYEKETWYIYCSFAQSDVTVPLAHDTTDPVIGNYDASPIVTDQKLTLRPYEAIVYRTVPEKGTTQK
ncbi:glycoside hydrolase family 13 protein [Exiguobacterium antarcticum]|uniref:glycoside hydrolase family 13 protein n=1 Tax=Exiguobacterium antarcticum TaxID=132920 RepID=UPI000285E69D|nr:alpha-glucosidase [Exiguobacterium antarcticum]AFS70703.1 Oligo-1,6-glucosidase [Exiguobacterium antarcticum B7]